MTNSFCLTTLNNLDNIEKTKTVVTSFNSSLFFPEVNNNLTFTLKIGFRTCVFGEMLDPFTKICTRCPQGFFSWDIEFGESTLCQTCTESKPFFCYGGNELSPKPGFWRANENSYKFLICPNLNACLGDPFFEREDPQYYRVYTSASARGFCLKGYTGVLCAECEEGYGVTDKYTCAPCESREYYIMLVVKLTFRVIVIYISLWTALGMNKSLQKYNSIELYIAEMNYFLKIMLNHFQVIMMLFSLRFNFPETFKKFISVFVIASAPELGEAFSFECLLRNYEIPIPYQYFKLIALTAFNFITFVIFLLLQVGMQIFYKKNKRIKFKTQKINQKVIPSSQSRHRLNILFKCEALMLLLFMITFVDQLKPFIELYSCIDIGGDPDEISASNSKRLVAQLNIICDSETHRSWIFYFSLPYIMVVGVALPVYIFANLVRKQRSKELFSKKIRGIYGYMYYPYRNKTYYYEFFVLLRKASLLLIHVFFFSFFGEYGTLINSVNSCFLLLVVVLLFFLLQIYLNPFKENYFKRVNQTDIVSFLSLIFSIIAAIIWTAQRDSISTWLSFFLFSVGSIFNFCFLIFWSYHFLAFIKIEATKYLVAFRNRIHILPKIGNGIKARKHTVFFLSENPQIKSSLAVIDKVDKIKISPMTNSKLSEAANSNMTSSKESLSLCPTPLVLKNIMKKTQNFMLEKIPFDEHAKQSSKEISVSSIDRGSENGGDRGFDKEESEKKLHVSKNKNVKANKDFSTLMELKDLEITSNNLKFNQSIRGDKKEVITRQKGDSQLRNFLYRRVIAGAKLLLQNFDDLKIFLVRKTLTGSNFFNYFLTIDLEIKRRKRAKGIEIGDFYHSDKDFVCHIEEKTVAGISDPRLLKKFRINARLLGAMKLKYTGKIKFQLEIRSVTQNQLILFDIDVDSQDFALYSVFNEDQKTFEKYDNLIERFIENNEQNTAAIFAVRAEEKFLDLYSQVYQKLRDYEKIPQESLLGQFWTNGITIRFLASGQIFHQFIRNKLKSNAGVIICVKDNLRSFDLADDTEVMEFNDFYLKQ